MRYIIPFLLIFIVSCREKSQNVPDKNPELENLASLFFEKYRNNSPGEAVDFIFSKNQGVTKDQLLNVKDKLSSFSNLAGAYNGYELITTQYATKSLILMSYLVKHEIQPYRIIFIFYKPKNEWKIYKFKIDDQLDAELEDSGKVYFLQVR